MSRLLLKIVGGIHTGAEMPLQKGRYRIGRSLDCAITLQDELVADEHIELTCVDGKVMAKAISGSVFYVNGQQAPTEEESAVVIDQADIVEIGTSFFSIGEMGKSWAPVEVIPHSATRKLSFLESLAHDITEKFDQLKNQVQVIISDLKSLSYFKRLTKKVGLLPESATLLEGPRAPQQKTGESDDQNMLVAISEDSEQQAVSPWQKRLAVLASFGATLIISYPLLLKLVPKESDYALVSELIEENNYDSVVLEQLEDEIALTGYVQNYGDKKTIVKFLRKKKISADVNIFTDTTIKKKLEDIRDIMGLDALQLNYEGSGSAEVTGYVAQLDDWQSFRETALDDIPGLIDLQNSGIRNLSFRKSKLQEIIDSNGLEGSIKVAEGRNSSLVVSGMLPPNQIKQWSRSIKDFRAEYGDKPEIISRVKNPIEAIDLSIKELQLGDIKFIVTRDGTRYFEGAFIPGGFLVKSIDSDYVKLEKDGIIANYPVGA